MNDKRRESLIYPLAIIVMLGWVGSLALAFLRGEYTPLTVVTPVMLLLAGYVFGTSIIRTTIGKDSE